MTGKSGGAVRVFNHLSQWPDETWQAIYALTWGMWLLSPFRAFGAYPEQGFLASLMYEPAWGGMTLAIALLSLILTYRGHRYGRVAANAILAPGWIFMAWVAIAGVPPAAIGIMLAVLGLRQLVLLVDAICVAVEGTGQ